MTLHVFTARHQDATAYSDGSGELPLLIRNHPRKQLRCYGCGRVRYAANLTVQCFYDSIRFWCRGGCKPPGDHITP